MHRTHPESRFVLKVNKVYSDASVVTMSASVHETKRTALILESTGPGPDCEGAHEDRRWAETVLAGEKRVLEMIAGGNELCSILETLCQVAEEISCGPLCSIQLLDGASWD